MAEVNELGLKDSNPFVLFLILVLLILSTNGKADEHLENLKQFVLETRNAMNNIRAGVANMHANMLNFHSRVFSQSK